MTFLVRMAGFVFLMAERLQQIWHREDSFCLYKMAVLVSLLLAYRPAPQTFQLALRGYSVASLPRASHLHLASISLARSRALRAHENF